MHKHIGNWEIKIYSLDRIHRNVRVTQCKPGQPDLDPKLRQNVLKSDLKKSRICPILGANLTHFGSKSGHQVYFKVKPDVDYCNQRIA